MLIDGPHDEDPTLIIEPDAWKQLERSLLARIAADEPESICGLTHRFQSVWKHRGRLVVVTGDVLFEQPSESSPPMDQGEPMLHVFRLTLVRMK